jgi:uncharacterized membrane protein YccC
MAASQVSQPPAWRLTARSLRPKWSVPAAMRALRATLVVPSMLAITDEGFHNPQMALFAVFGAFASLVLSSFGGSRRDKTLAHLSLAVVGSVGLIIGTLASGNAVVAGVVTLVVAFVIYFGGMAGPNAASGVTAALLAYIIAVASDGGVSTIPARLGGWWLASVVSTIAVLTLSPKSPGDRLRQSAAELSRALAHHLQAAVDGTATPADLAATVAAKHQLMALFEATPYRPIGIATADQALASMISLLEWCTSLVTEAMDGHLDLSAAAPEDIDLLAEAAAALGAAGDLLDGRRDSLDLEGVSDARLKSAVHLRGLAGEPATVRRMADHAFHAQAIAIAVMAAAADATVASRCAEPDWARSYLPDVTGSPAQPAQSAGRARLWLALLPPPLVSRAIVRDASIRSVWFRNSARGAVAIAAAVTIARLTDVQHAFWVVLGTLSVLRSSVGATGSTALRALAGTTLGFVVGAALLVGIGVSPAALWTALPLAVLVAAYTPGTAPFVIGQAAFTITVVVLFNVLAPAGWQVGLIRVEDVAIGCAVSVVVGVLFWPRGAYVLVGDNLADALRAGAADLAESTRVALGVAGRPPPGQITAGASTAAAASVRLADAVRAYLTEQGSKRLAKEDLRTLTMSVLRLRLTAISLASLPDRDHAAGPAADHPVGAAARDRLTDQSAALAGFYDAIAAEVDRPHVTPGTRANGSAPAAIDLPADPADVQLCTLGPAHYHPEALWVRDHLAHLGSHSGSIIEPAGRLAALRRRPWWR